MPAELVVGGDQPFVRRLIGVSISPMVGSIYNMGVWDKVVAAWVKAGVRRTLEGEAVACRRYQETGLSLENGGCVGDPQLWWSGALSSYASSIVARPWAASTWPSLRPTSGTFPSTPGVAVQCMLCRARTGVRFGASASPDGEEARALFLAWEELGPLLAYAPEDNEWQAVVAMRDLLRDLYLDTPPSADLRAAEVARAYRLHCCKAACQSNYLFYLEEDVTLAVTNAARLGVSLGAVCADVV